MRPKKHKQELKKPGFIASPHPTARRPGGGPRESWTRQGTGPVQPVSLLHHPAPPAASVASRRQPFHIHSLATSASQRCHLLRASGALPSAFTWQATGFQPSSLTPQHSRECHSTRAPSARLRPSARMAAPPGHYPFRIGPGILGQLTQKGPWVHRNSPGHGPPSSGPRGEGIPPPRPGAASSAHHAPDLPQCLGRRLPRTSRTSSSPRRGARAATTSLPIRERVRIPPRQSPLGATAFPVHQPGLCPAPVRLRDRGAEGVPPGARGRSVADMNAPTLATDRSRRPVQVSCQEASSNPGAGSWRQPARGREKWAAWPGRASSRRRAGITGAEGSSPPWSTASSRPAPAVTLRESNGSHAQDHPGSTGVDKPVRGHRPPPP